MALDPCQLVYEALEAGGWDPKGPLHKFRANCPAHGGDSHQLKVDEAADGTALLFCHTRQCSQDEIVAALGLRRSDLFPAGHERARDVRLTQPPAEPKRRAKKVLDILTQLDEIKEPWRVVIMTDCMFCGAPGAMIVTTEPRAGYTYLDLDGQPVTVPAQKGGGLVASCLEGCSDRAYNQGLSGKVIMSRAES